MSTPPEVVRILRIAEIFFEIILSIMQRLFACDIEFLLQKIHLVRTSCCKFNYRAGQDYQKGCGRRISQERPTEPRSWHLFRHAKKKNVFELTIKKPADGD